MNAFAPMAIEVGREPYKLTLDDWAAMDAAGSLPRDIDFELIDGALIEMPADGPMHRRYHSALLDWVVSSRPKEFKVVIDETLPWARHNGPKPDLYLFPRTVHERDLKPTDVVWVVEIADTSLGYDQRVKGPLYASAGIRDYWIIDINSQVVRVHRDPVDGAYSVVLQVSATEAVSPLCAPDMPLRLADLQDID
jgi:Uma2 family endonuclease